MYPHAEVSFTFLPPPSTSRAQNPFHAITDVFPPQFLGNDPNVVVSTGKFGNFTVNSWPQMLAAAGQKNAAQAMEWIEQNNYTKVSVH